MLEVQIILVGNILTFKTIFSKYKFNASPPPLPVECIHQCLLIVIKKEYYTVI